MKLKASRIIFLPGADLGPFVWLLTQVQGAAVKRERVVAFRKLSRAFADLGLLHLPVCEITHIGRATDSQGTTGVIISALIDVEDHTGAPNAA